MDLQTFKESFESKLFEYEAQHQGSRCKPWTREKMNEVINHIRIAKASMNSNQRKTSMDYYWISKYDIMIADNEYRLIFKKKTSSDPTVLIIPRDKYFAVIKEAHESCGHGGRDKITHALKMRFYIPKKAIEIFVALCPTCEMRKNFLKKDSMPLQQRLNTIVSNSFPPPEENQPPPSKSQPPLKSQPLSPTKLKVTRQSTSKSVQEVATPPSDSTNEEVCLRWNSHHSNMQSAFPNLLSKEQYCDVTLVADGKSLKCHKLILSSCSSYFDQVLEKIMPYQHPVIFMKDIPFNILKSLCDFMYAGEVNILQGDLDQLLAVAESLKIKGLANKVSSNTSDNPHPPPAEPKESKDHHQQKSKETASSRFIKIAPKPTSSGVADFKKLSSPKAGANGDVTDPLDLMEPTYEEDATVDMPPQLALKRTEPQRRSLGKRVRKRKHIGEEEHESSPPVFRSRKGTRSRPNVKVPRYFNASFDNSNEHAAPSEGPELHQDTGVDPCADPLLDLLEEIKTEPVDIEDSLIEESYDAVRSSSMRLASVVTKQEKEDAPDPLNVEPGDEQQHRHSEEDTTETSNAVENANSVEGHETGLAEPMENANSVEGHETGLAEPVENANSVEGHETELAEPVENANSGEGHETGLAEPMENANSVEGHETELAKHLTVESSTKENMADAEEENSQEVLSITGTFSALENLPENDTS